MTPRSRSGFTLLELMIVVTIIGTLAAMAAAAAQRIGKQNSVQNAAADISSLLQEARARAEARGSDVYVMVYPTMKRTTGALTGGNGALLMYEDANGDFLTGTGACTGAGTVDCSWANFTPPNNVQSPPANQDRFIKAIYLDDYSKQNVKFGKRSTTVFAQPFTSITGAAATAGCSFCTSGKGAIVFTGDQQVRFLKDDKTVGAQRVAGLAISAKDNDTREYLFGLVGATGLVTLVK